jgi:5-methylcytosine-specific restriction enzyme A
MSALPKIPCRKPGCPAKLERGNGSLCPEHRKAEYRKQDQRRSSSTQRGYDADWRRVRDWKRATDPLCEQCWKDGTITPMAEVHHIIPIAVDRSRRLDVTNLVSLCKACHSRITMQESVR